MCKLILGLIFVWITGFVAAISIAAIFGPWWSVPLVILGYILISAALLRLGFRTLLMIPFKMKGKVLRGATIQVHSIERGKAPERKSHSQALAAGDDEDDEEDEGDQEDDEGDQDDKEVDEADDVDEAQEESTVRAVANDDKDYFWVDVTITPAAAGAEGKFRSWEPGELVLMPAGETPSWKNLKEDGDEPHSYEVQIWQNGTWGDDDPGKYEGAQRVRLLFGVKPAFDRRAKFRYYFEGFGELRLPDATFVR